MKKFNIADIIAAATVAYCILKMASSIASRRGTAKAVAKRGAEIVATTRHDLSINPG